MFQARKEDSLRKRIAGGHGPFRGLGAPCALEFDNMRIAKEKSSLENRGESMEAILLDNVVKVQYRDSHKSGWLTEIHVNFDEPGQVSVFLGPGLRLALSLLEDQFQPETA